MSQYPRDVRAARGEAAVFLPALLALPCVRWHGHETVPQSVKTISGPSISSQEIPDPRMNTNKHEKERQQARFAFIRVYSCPFVDSFFLEKSLRRTTVNCPAVVGNRFFLLCPSEVFVV